MEEWTTNLECGGQHLVKVNIKRGIFQEDSLLTVTVHHLPDSIKCDAKGDKAWLPAEQIYI